MKSRNIFKQITSAVMAAVTAASLLPAYAAEEAEPSQSENKFSYDELVGDCSAPWDGTVATDFAGGSGSEKDPYLISTAEQLAYFGALVDGGSEFWGQYFKLTQNIIINENVDNNPKEWNPIGSVDSSAYFNGIFDGNNFDVVGVYTSSSESGRGLFAFLYTNGVIKNLGTVNGKLVNPGIQSGNLCGVNYGTIENCHNNGSVDITTCVDGGSEQTGAFCGCVDTATIVNCYNEGDLRISYSNGSYSDSRFGGIVGDSYDSIIKNCYNTGEIYCYNSNNYINIYYVGGICGYGMHARIENCYNTGKVTSEYGIGGISGYMYSDEGYISDCYNTGEIVSAGSQCYTAGICGYLSKSAIRNCYNTGKINGSANAGIDSAAGGICGYADSNATSIIDKCYNAGEIVGAYSGGISGYSGNLVSNCYNTGKVQVGGICYRFYNLTNCYNMGKAAYPINVTIKSGGTIENVYFDSNVFPDNTGDAMARTTEQLTAPTAVADLGFDAAVWAKKENTKYYRYYPNLIALDNDDPYYIHSVPKDVAAVAGTSEVTLTWSAVPTATKYAVYSYLNGTYTTETTNATTDSFTVKNLINNTKYGFKVKSYVDGQWSDASEIVYATPFVPAPTEVKAAAGNGTAKITWAKVSGATRYAVYLYEGSKATCINSNITTNSYTATGLTNRTKYGFKVKAYANGGWSAASGIVYAKPVTPVPTDVKAAAGNGTAKITWAKVDGAARYAVYLYEGSKATCINSNITTNSYTTTGLTNGTKYGFKVKAYANGGWSAASGIVYATPEAPNIIPENLKIANGDGKVQVTWDEVADSTKYAVYSYYNGVYTTETTSATTNTYTVTGLTNGEKYGFKVKSYVNGKWSAASSIIYARPSASTAPGAIKAIAGNQSAEVKWSGVIGATRYAVYKYENGVYTCINSNIKDTNYTVTGLTNGTKYGFKVKAYVDGAWSAASVIAYATPTV